MNPVVFHLVSGDAYFSGFLLVLLAVWFTNSKQKIFNRLCFACWFIGFVFILITAVPSSLLEYIILPTIFTLSTGVIFQLFSKFFTSPERNSISRYRWNGLISVLIFIATINELSWRSPTKFNSLLPRKLIIFADSITAGIGEHEAITWPQILGEQQDLEIYDYSRMGATVGSQLKWLHTRELPDGLIIIELGGNDMFGATPVDDYRSDLNSMLKRLIDQQITVLMFELPIPPTFNRFGIAQRRLARRYGVQMIPKKVLTQILAAKNSTLDTIHLSQTGHQLMSAAVWEQVQAAFIE